MKHLRPAIVLTVFFVVRDKTKLSVLSARIMMKNSIFSMNK